ncbi:MAG: hypothetical protein WDN47_00240 [Candidatus Doudnabacteria bacterium]
MQDLPVEDDADAGPDPAPQNARPNHQHEENLAYWVAHATTPRNNRKHPVGQSLLGRQKQKEQLG